MLDFVDPIRWDEDRLIILDQTLLPIQEKNLKVCAVEEVWEAIKLLRVRGAPLIGLAAAFGMYLGLRSFKDASEADFNVAAQKTADYLKSARPTAVNLQWAVERILNVIHHSNNRSIVHVLEDILAEAKKMIVEDHEVCRAIGQHGLEILRSNMGVLTHCNAGGLATGGHGTALAPIYAAHQKGMQISVYSDETRPLLQGARLTAWELQRAGVPVTVICDNMAASVMAQKKVDLVIVGGDRVAANGDFANKIGTYGVAILAKEHGIPFYCAVPRSTIDLSLSDGGKIPIEKRDSEEITHLFGKQTAPSGVHIFNPAFDVTPHHYVTAFITEKGLVTPPFSQNLRNLFS